MDVVLIGLCIVVGLFLIRMVVLSVWDAWALKKSMAAVEVAPVFEIDTEYKDRLRVEQHRGWDADFMDALGEDRDEFVRQWADGSERKQLADLLKADEAYAEKRKDVWTQAEISAVRWKLVQSPATPLSVEEIESIKESRRRWNRRWAA